VALLGQLVDTIRDLSHNKKVYQRPRGRPRKNPTYEAYPIARPSSIPKIERFKLTQRDLMDITIVRKHKDLLEEYKNLLLNKFRNNTKLANKRYIANIKDMTKFFQRLPRKIEQELLLDPILPSELSDRPISALLDKGLYLKEVNGKLRHFRYSYIFTEEKIAKIETKADIMERTTGEVADIASLYIEFKMLVRALWYDIKIAKRLKLGFFTLLKLTCYYRDDDGSRSKKYINSLTHRRMNLLISKVSDIKPVIRLLGDEVLIRIYELNEGKSGLNFS
jgi:hypothetical protein